MKKNNLALRFSAILLAISLTACAHKSANSLDGLWMLTTVNAVEQKITVRNLGSGFIYLHHPEQHLSGKYEVVGTELSLVEPDNPRTQAVALQLNSKNQMTVTEAPETRLTGIRYRGAVIQRIPIN